MDEANRHVAEGERQVAKARTGHYISDIGGRVIGVIYQGAS